MWEKFTERARRSVVLAQEEAQRLGCTYIGTEHILLGLLAENDGAAAKILATFNITLFKARQELEFIIGRGERTVQSELEFTPRAKRVFEAAEAEVAKINKKYKLSINYTSTEHLLLGLLEEGNGVAARVLSNLGVNRETLRDKIIDFMVEEVPAEKTNFIDVNKLAKVMWNLDILINDTQDLYQLDNKYQIVLTKLQEADMWLKKIKDQK
jgi:ATP-dependent Clp protease ATP-binding subunit ClpC